MTGVSPVPPKSRSIASATTRELLSVGMTVESTGVQFTPVAGSATASISAAVTAATTPGRRMTPCARRCQRSCAAAAPRSCFGSSLRPHSASSAGEIASAATAATIATVAPAIPIDCAKPSGKTVSVASAAATVADEKTTVRPAVAIVVRIASRWDAPPPSSSRNRVTRNSV